MTHHQKWRFFIIFPIITLCLGAKVGQGIIRNPAGLDCLKAVVTLLKQNHDDFFEQTLEARIAQITQLLPRNKPSLLLTSLLRSQFLKKHGSARVINATNKGYQLGNNIPLINLDNLGKTNRSLFLYAHPDGERIIKLFTSKESHFQLSEENVISQLTFLRYLRGNLLAEREGGPRVYAFGKTTIDGEKVWYIEMEKMGESGDMTLKDAILDESGSSFARIFQSFPRFYESFADKLITAFENDVTPKDLDLFFSFKDRSIRWIDGDYWVPLNETQTIRIIIGNCFKLGKSLPEANQSLFTALKQRINISTRLTSEKKRQLIKQMNQLHQEIRLSDGY